MDMFCILQVAAFVGSHHNRFLQQHQIMDNCKISHVSNQDPHETDGCRNTFCKSRIDECPQNQTSKIKCPVSHTNTGISQPVQAHQSVQHVDVHGKHEEDRDRRVEKVERIEHTKGRDSPSLSSCEYHIVGCDAKIEHQHRMEHNEKYTKKHFSLVLECVQQLNNTKQKLEQTERKLAEREHEATNQLRAAARELRDTKAMLVYTEGVLADKQASLADNYETNMQLDAVEMELTDIRRKLENTERKLAEVSDHRFKLLILIICAFGLIFIYYNYVLVIMIMIAIYMYYYYLPKEHNT